MTHPDTEYLTTRELAELLRIKERKVYDLASSGEVPCTRATGKLLFPKKAVDAWLAQHGNAPRLQPVAERPEVFLGSHDPLLEWALKQSGCHLASYFDGSLDGLERFAAGEGIAAALHIYETGTDDWNRETIARRFSGQSVVLMEFCWRERGLILNPELMPSVQSVKDLKGRRLVPRQILAGSQLLLIQLLERQGLSIDDISFSDIAYTETDAASAVLDGTADAALGLESLARRLNLGFLPLMRERFDLLVDRRAWFEPAFQTFLSFCNSKAFQERAESVDGYDVSGFGTIRFNG